MAYVDPMFVPLEPYSPITGSYFEYQAGGKEEEKKKKEREKKEGKEGKKRREL